MDNMKYIPCAKCPQGSCDWLTPTVLRIARAIYDDKDFETCPILADALEDADCENKEVLQHLRGMEKCTACLYFPGRGGDQGHGDCSDCGGTGWRPRGTQCVRGCWVLDLLTERE